MMVVPIIDEKGFVLINEVDSGVTGAVLPKLAELFMRVCLQLVATLTPDLLTEKIKRDFVD